LKSNLKDFGREL